MVRIINISAKLVLSIAVLLMLAVPIAAASQPKVALIVKNAGSLSNDHEQKIYDILSGMNMDVTKVDSSNAGGTDFNQFILIVLAGRTTAESIGKQVCDGPTSFAALLPVQDIPTIAIDSPCPGYWGWVQPGGVTLFSTGGIQKIYIDNNAHSITQDYSPGPLNVHIIPNKGILGMDKTKTPFSGLAFESSSTKGFGIIAVAEAGTQLIGNKTQAVKAVFFGLSYPGFWTTDSEKLFKRAMGWVLGDADNDAIADPADNCPEDINYDQADMDSDGIGDVCDTDIDGDGVSNTIDDCPYNSDPTQPDSDADGVGDACDNDADNDGINNTLDNCPAVANPDQANMDADSYGDLCDSDLDGDDINNAIDNCPNNANADQLDTDHDNTGDVCDPDKDGDGINNALDNCPDVSNPTQADADSDGKGDACDTCAGGGDGDDDGDGITNCLDNCPNMSNANQADTDHDGIGDVCDSVMNTIDLLPQSTTFSALTECGSGTATVVVKNVGNTNATSFALEITSGSWKANQTSGALAAGANTTIQVALAQPLTCGASKTFTTIVKSVMPYESVSGNNQRNDTVTITQAATRLAKNVDSDTNLEVIVDTGSDGIYDVFYDPDDASKQLATADVDADGKADFIIDTNSDSKPEKVWTFTNTLLNILSQDVSNDGTADSIIDSDGSGTVTSNDKVYSSGSVYTLPDLTVESISFSPSSPKSGDSVTITARVKNTGFAASSFILELRREGSILSTKTASVSSNTYTDVTFTNSPSQGSYEFKATADSGNVIKEKNEDNNYIIRDLTVSAKSTTTASTSSSSGFNQGKKTTPAPTPTPTPAPTPEPAPEPEPEEQNTTEQSAAGEQSFLGGIAAGITGFVVDGPKALWTSADAATGGNMIYIVLFVVTAGVAFFMIKRHNKPKFGFEPRKSIFKSLPKPWAKPRKSFGSFGSMIQEGTERLSHFKPFDSGASSAPKAYDRKQEREDRALRKQNEKEQKRQEEIRSKYAEEIRKRAMKFDKNKLDNNKFGKNKIKGRR